MLEEARRVSGREGLATMQLDRSNLQAMLCIYAG